MINKMGLELGVGLRSTKAAGPAALSPSLLLYQGAETGDMSGMGSVGGGVVATQAQVASGAWSYLFPTDPPTNRCTINWGARNSFRISFRVRPTTLTVVDDVLLCSSPSTIAIALRTGGASDPAKLVIRIANFNGLPSPNAMLLNQWNDIVFQVAAGDRAKLWLNGVLQTDRDITADVIATQPEILLIGFGGGDSYWDDIVASSDPYDTSIDGVRIGLTAPVNTVAPVISPTTNLFVGTVLTATQGTWTNSPTSYSYQFKADGVAVQDSSSNTYTVQVADVGKIMSVTTLATNATGTGQANSNNTAAVIGPPVNTVAPTINYPSPFYTGVELSANLGTWVPAPAGYSTIWYADGVQVHAGSLYTPNSAQVGKLITAKITASNASGSGEATSAPTTRILFSTRDAPGLISHFKSTVASSIVSSGGNVSQFNDLIAGAGSIAQGTPGNQPTVVAEATVGGKNVIRFNGTSSYLIGNMNRYNSANVTVIATVILRNAGVSSGRIFCMTDNVADDGGGAQNMALARQGVTANFRGIVGGTGVASSPVLTYDTPHSFKIMKDADSFDIGNDDRDTPVVTAKVATLDLIRRSMGVGIAAGGAAGANFGANDVCEVAVLDHSATVEEINKICGAMAWFWASSMVDALPASHPYKSAPP